jgi:hypothetical protein
MPLDPARVADVRSWLAKAAEDLRAAAHGLAGAPVHGSCDVVPTHARDEFLTPYCRDPAKHARLQAAQRSLAVGEWNFPELPEPAAGPERSRRAGRRPR